VEGCDFCGFFALDGHRLLVESGEGQAVVLFLGCAPSWLTACRGFGGLSRFWNVGHDAPEGWMVKALRDVVLKTSRLILRPTAAEDFEGWAAMMADDKNTEFIGGLQERPVAWRSFLTMAGAWTIQGFGMFSVIEKETGDWIGRVGPWMPEGWPGSEVGWAIRRDRWGRGYAVEAATAAIDWVFDVLGWDEVIHSISPNNTASQAVATRLGSRLRGVGQLPAPMEMIEIDIWSQTREQWRARRGAG
jgi:RimJ/RimL family protein N-acetyltransferase